MQGLAVVVKGKYSLLLITVCASSLSNWLSETKNSNAQRSSVRWSVQHSMETFPAVAPFVETACLWSVVDEGNVGQRPYSRHNSRQFVPKHRQRRLPGASFYVSPFPRWTISPPTFSPLLKQGMGAASARVPGSSFALSFHFFD